MIKKNELFAVVIVLAAIVVLTVGLPVKSHGQFQPCVWPNKCINK